ncbi:hypothetical protein P7C70_g5479, partial [Phenoliferia sp. Uapishka_3]
MMAEIMIAAGEANEAGRVIAKGISAASKHADLAPYLPPLYSLQASLTTSTTNIASSSTLKFAKSTLKRAIESTSPHTLPQWVYHLHFQLSSLCASSRDFAGALSALKNVEIFAEVRGDENVLWTTRVMVARLAVGEGEFKVAKGALSKVAAWMGFDMSDPTVEDGKAKKAKQGEQLGAVQVLETPIKVLSRQLVIQFLLIFCLFQAREGNVKLAKEKLKMAHQLLDEKEIEEGEGEGWTKLKIRPAEPTNRGKSSAPSSSGSISYPTSSPYCPPPPTPLSVTVLLAPKTMVYDFAFLVSVAVHRDPFGSKPRSTLFANEGLRTLDAKLAGTEALPPLAPQLVRPHLLSLCEMSLHLSLFSAELAIMRSSFPVARQHLNSALSLARTHGLWNTSKPGAVGFKSRLTLDEGLLAQAQAQTTLAEQCFLAVLRIKGEPTSQETPEDVTSLALISLLTLRLTMGIPVRELSPIVASIISKTNHPSASPSLVLIAELAQALTKGEITKSKSHLSEALKRANATLANHAKAVILALLANLFLFTRNDQAQKMLAASYNIAKGMGSRGDGKPPEVEQVKGIVGDESVGNARLGLWVGERLLESFRRNEPAKVKKQEALNTAHRRVVEKEQSAS